MVPSLQRAVPLPLLLNTPRRRYRAVCTCSVCYCGRAGKQLCTENTVSCLAWEEQGGAACRLTLIRSFMYAARCWSWISLDGRARLEIYGNMCNGDRPWLFVCFISLLKSIILNQSNPRGLRHSSSFRLTHDSVLLVMS